MSWETCRTCSLCRSRPEKPVSSLVWKVRGGSTCFGAFSARNHISSRDVFPPSQCSSVGAVCSLPKTSAESHSCGQRSGVDWELWAAAARERVLGWTELSRILCSREDQSFSPGEILPMKLKESDKIGL